MSKKEKLQQADPEADSTPVAGSEPQAESNPVIIELEKQLAEAQSQTAEYKDGWQRSVADFQNYRRRV